MRIVVALGGNALLRPGEPMTIDNQRHNVRRAARGLAELAGRHQLVVTHGNGPQVGLLALQAQACQPTEAVPLDVLDAQTEGMIGYLIEAELMNAMPAGASCATLLTRVEVDADDPAFLLPSKPIGPEYGLADMQRWKAERGWAFVASSPGHWRRVVASPLPRRILPIDVIGRLVDAGVVVICAGGGGIPTVRGAGGRLEGIEAVIDKDHASGLLATRLDADALLLLTDVAAVYQGWGGPAPSPLARATPEMLGELAFEPGSMGPKVTAACEFVTARGGVAGIGALEDAERILEGLAGTLIHP
ncbi:Carbamate kinase 2 [Halomonas sp. THAF5a]|uniref:carbamate kinase n=1 Tax=Halomonas sp. THAF5a TaxID=2587844 RepID=UPI001268EF4A|nr:carbamate kinase [Halomonas sp. THAF5a]QFU02041.1 Carbamate kinase 2 [Halomonas sp. THAF5a]